MKPSPTRRLELACPAKVNLVLSVGTPVDGPLHPLVSWMVAVDFADTLSLARSGGTASQFDIRPAASSHRDRRPPVAVDWPLESDLAYRAHRILQDHCGTPLAVDLTLQKQIPPGAGLGGGSSNAAATLVALDRLFGLKLNRKTLIGLGQQLGSDVGYLVAVMLGDVSALVTGVGDEIEPLPLDRAIDMVLIFPPFGCPTGKIFAAFDRLGGDKPHTMVDPQTVRDTAANLPLAATTPRNDLALAAFSVVSELERITDRLGQQLQHPVHVTGSGSTLFLIAPSQAAAGELATRAAAVSGLPAVATQTLSGEPRTHD